MIITHAAILKRKLGERPDMAVIVALIPFRKLVYSWRSQGDDIEHISETPAVRDVGDACLGKIRVADARRTVSV
ncbi:hypothetical protein D3C78_1904020 [compost metagenome]